MVLWIRGRALPTGEPLDLYADGDRWTTDPVANAELVSDGGWLLPGSSTTTCSARTSSGTSTPASR